MKKKLKGKIFTLFGSAFVGILNGFFGGGGGMVCVPIIEKGMKITNKQAHATTIAVILPISIFSAFVWGFKTPFDVSTIVWVGIGSLVGGILGAIILKKVQSRAIRFIFASIVLIAGIKVIFW